MADEIASGWRVVRGVRVWFGLLPDDPRHGSVAGYRAHQTIGESPCLPCLDGMRDYRAAQYERSKSPCAECGKPTGRTLCRSCATAAGNRGRTLDRKEFCVHGHRLSPDNRTSRGDGCLTCHRNKMRAARAEARIRHIENAIADHWTAS